MRKKAFCAIVVLVLLLNACTKSTASWQEQYDLGVRYLSEGKYEEAVIAFNAAIEIDPKRADAYIGLADAYMALGDVEQARLVLEDALAVVTNPSVIQSRLSGLEGSAAPEPTPGITAEPAPIPEQTPVSALEPAPSVTVIASGDCGETATWALYSSGLLTISGTGAMIDYTSADAPWLTILFDITDVIIEDGITSIGSNAFSGCRRLTDVTIGSSVTSIGTGAFYYCGSLTSVTVPDSVTNIGWFAFSDCSNLTSVTIPDSVTSIGHWAFDNCGSLEDVYYGGSEAQWNQIADEFTDALLDESTNSFLLNATIHYNS